MRYLLFLLITFVTLSTVNAQGKFQERLSKTGTDDLYLLEFAAGDTLVYEVNAGGNIYEFIAILKTYDLSDKGFSFDWKMSAPLNLSGTVSVLADAFLNSRSYINRFGGGPLVLKDACTVFMTAQNFGEMPQKESKLILDGEEVTFYRPDNDEAPYKLKVAGEDYTLDGFKINDNKDGTGDNTLVIQGISSHPLILAMDLGFKIRLKEIR